MEGMRPPGVARVASTAVAMRRRAVAPSGPSEMPCAINAESKV